MTHLLDAAHQEEGPAEQIDLYVAYRVCNPDDKIDRATFGKKLEEMPEDERYAFVETTTEKYRTIQQAQQQRARNTIEGVRKNPAELRRVGEEFLQMREDIERASQ
jgi:hypothetical protein